MLPVFLKTGEWCMERLGTILTKYNHICRQHQPLGHVMFEKQVKNKNRHRDIATFEAHIGRFEIAKKFNNDLTSIDFFFFPIISPGLFRKIF